MERASYQIIFPHKETLFNNDTNTSIRGFLTKLSKLFTVSICIPAFETKSTSLKRGKEMDNFFIPSLGIYIPKHGMYIPRHGIYIP